MFKEKKYTLMYTEGNKLDGTKINTIEGKKEFVNNCLVFYSHKHAKQMVESNHGYQFKKKLDNDNLEEIKEKIKKNDKKTKGNPQYLVLVKQVENMSRLDVIRLAKYKRIKLPKVKGKIQINKSKSILLDLLEKEFEKDNNSGSGSFDWTKKSYKGNQYGYRVD